MNGTTVWCVAVHEMRIHRRLVRTHVFIGVALLLCTCYFLVVTLNHMRPATHIPMLGVISPRYIVSLLSGSFLTLFCVGVLVLTFDQINRDQRNHVQEVIGSKPLRDIELFIGRLLGVILMMAIPMLLFLIGIVVYGIIAETVSLRFGEPVEIWSVLSFVFLDIVPNFAFFW